MKLLQDCFSARTNAYEKELPGIKDYNDILHYMNWQPPRLHLINPNFDSGEYAGDNNWNRKVREIYSELAFDGAAGQDPFGKSNGEYVIIGVQE